MKSLDLNELDFNSVDYSTLEHTSFDPDADHGESEALGYLGFRCERNGAIISTDHPSSFIED